jgi:U3 small nucleolar RNA-associated protein 7
MSGINRLKDDSWDPNGTSGVARGGTTTSKRTTPSAAAAAATTATSTNSDINKSQHVTPQQRRHIQQRHNKKATALLERYETKLQKAQQSRDVAASILQDNYTGSTKNEHGVNSSGGSGMIQVENDMERTTALTQVQLQRDFLKDNPSMQQHIYDLQLGTHYAPYKYIYDRSGRYSLITGQQQGHIAVMDNYQRTLVSEIHLKNERIRDVTFLHNFTMYALAQQNHVYIYDGTTGAEIHCLTEHGDPFNVTYLPHHWLLASVGRMGYLKYHDTSTGSLVSTHRTKLGPSTSLKVNPSNAIVHAGHTNGTVTLWSPAQSNYLVKMKCTTGGSSTAITDLAIDQRGHTMVTCGMDRQIRVWDLRMYQERHSYYCVAGTPTTVDISQRGLLGIGHAGHVTVWDADALQQKVSAPYMHHKLGPAGMNHARGPVCSVRFRPFEDVCGIGHANGVSSIVVPGSGEPALDTSEYHTNPMEDAKQRRETEVRSLLDKLLPDMICIEDATTTVGGMEEYDPTVRLDKLRETQELANASPRQKTKVKNKKRGRSKIQSKLRTRQRNVIDHKMVRLQQAAEEEKLVKEIEKKHNSSSSTLAVNDESQTNNTKQQHQSSMLFSTIATESASTPTALKRFFT